MPSTKIHLSRIRTARMPTRASMDASTSWNGKSLSTSRNSGTANTPWINPPGKKMKLKDFIVGAAVQPELAATDRDGAIRELVTALAQAGALPPDAVDEIVTALVKREQTGSTGFGKGVAVPHVKQPKVKKIAGTIGRSASGIDFAALDHQPVYSIFLLLSPDRSEE